MSGQRKRRQARRKTNRVIGAAVCDVWRAVIREGHLTVAGASGEPVDLDVSGATLERRYPASRETA